MYGYSSIHRRYIRCKKKKMEIDAYWLNYCYFELDTSSASDHTSFDSRNCTTRYIRSDTVGQIKGRVRIIRSNLVTR